MKKTLVLLTLSYSLLCANEIIQNNQNSFIDAKHYFIENNFELAYSFFKELNKNTIDDTKINFYLGRSAFELKKYEEALSAFERVLIKEPNHTRARLEFARTLYMLRMYEEAKLEFMKVRESNIPKAVRDNIDMFLLQIEQGTQKHSFNQILMLGIQYDDNINNVYGEEYLLSTNIGNLPINSEEKSDHFFEQMYLLNHRYDLGKMGDFTWDNTFLIYSQQYNETHSKNIEFASFTTGPTYTTSKYSFSIPLSYERLRYGSDTYLHAGSLGFKYNRFLNNTSLLNNTYTYKIKRNLISENKKSDSNIKEFSLGLYKILTTSSSLNSSFNYSIEKKDNDGVDVNLEKNKYGFNFIYSYIFNEYYKTSVSYLHERSNYKQENTLFNSKREDITNNISLTLTRTLFHNTSINAKYTRVNTNSNQEEYEYNKNIYGLNLMYQF